MAKTMENLLQGLIFSYLFFARIILRTLFLFMSQVFKVPIACLHYWFLMIVLFIKLYLQLYIIRDLSHLISRTSYAANCFSSLDSTFPNLGNAFIQHKC